MDKLEQLNKTLGDSCYINGHVPTKADIEEYLKVQKLLGNVRRWMNHISSFSETEIKSWPSAQVKAAPTKSVAAKAEDDDEIDLFGSDDDDGEAEKLKQKRQQEADAKKAEKKKPVAKSSVVIDVKTWDDETDMKDVENQVRLITMEGLKWGASKTVPLAYGIHKLQIGCVVEDELVSIDELTEKIEELDLVQSTDIAAFQKI